MAKNNGHQNFTQSLGILSPPPPYLRIIPKKQFFSASLISFTSKPFQNLTKTLKKNYQKENLTKAARVVPRAVALDEQQNFFGTSG